MTAIQGCHYKEKPTSPRIKPLRTRRWKSGDLQGITPGELQRMMKVSEKNDLHADRNTLMLRVGFAHGLRVSELLNLRVNDIDLANGQIHIERGKNGKTHDPELSNALQRSLRAYLKARQAKPDDFVFPGQWQGESKPMSRGYFHKWFSETAQAAGLPVAKQHPHALRHGLGFAMSAEGENPQAIGQALGHKSARMALLFYGQVNDAAADQARRRSFSKYSWL